MVLSWTYNLWWEWNVEVAKLISGHTLKFMQGGSWSYSPAIFAWFDWDIVVVVRQSCVGSRTLFWTIGRLWSSLHQVDGWGHPDSQPRCVTWCSTCLFLSRLLDWGPNLGNHSTYGLWRVFQVENLVLSVALTVFASKSTTGNGISVILCDFKFPTLFQESGCRWGRLRLESRTGPLLRMESVGKHSDTHKTPDV